MNNSQPTKPTSRREQLRQRQVEAARRQQRTRLIVVISAIVAVVLIGGAVWWGVASRQTTPTASGAQITPPNAVGDAGITVHPAGATTPAASAPTLMEYQDYQCPICKEYYTTFGPAFNQLVSQGKIKLEYRTMTFLDTNLRNDASTRAAVAAACADTVGAFEKYHDVVYANQPTTEGAGYTDQQLRVTFAQDAGITGANLTKFQQCYDNKSTLNFVQAVNTNAEKAGVTGTPTFKVSGNGKTVTLNLATVQPTATAVMAAITSALGG